MVKLCQKLKIEEGQRKIVIPRKHSCLMLLAYNQQHLTHLYHTIWQREKKSGIMGVSANELYIYNFSILKKKKE
jgi:hypothetical protein